MKPSSNGKSHGTPTVTRYNLIDPADDATIVATHVRLDYPDGTKDFQWERNGRRTLDGLSVSSLPPFNLDLLPDNRSGVTVVVCEGEKAALAATRCGFIGISWPGGASQRDFGPWLHYLGGENVVLWPDNDKTGKELMVALAGAIRNQEIEVTSLKILSAADLPEKGDAHDFLYDMHGGDERACRNAINYLIEAAPEAPALIPAQPTVRDTPERMSSQPTVKNEAVWEMAPAVDGNELLDEEDEPMQVFAEGLLYEGLILIAGSPKTGKSWLAMDIGRSLAAGTPLLGSIPVPEPCDVRYFPLEDGRRRFKRRMKMQSAAIRPENGRLKLWFKWPYKPINEGGLEQLDADISIATAAGRKVAVIIDTGKRIRPKSSGIANLYDEDYEFLSPLSDLAQRHHCLIIVISHTRKAPALDFIDTVTGSHGATGAVDNVAVFSRERHKQVAILEMTGRDGEEVKLTLRWQPDLFTWHVTDEAPPADPLREAMADIGRIVDLLAVGPKGQLEIRMALGMNSNRLKDVLELAVARGLIVQTGKGVRGEPFYYDLPDDREDR